MFRLTIILTLVMLGFVGCSNSEITDKELDSSEPHIIEGYIVEINGARILVANGISKEDAMEMTEESLLMADSIGKNAVWFSVKEINSYEVGQLVRVEFGTMNESYPGQSSAKRVQIVE